MTGRLALVEGSAFARSRAPSGLRPIRVAVAEDQALVRSGFVARLSGDPATANVKVLILTTFDADQSVARCAHGLDAGLMNR